MDLKELAPLGANPAGPEPMVRTSGARGLINHIAPALPKFQPIGYDDFGESMAKPTFSVKNFERFQHYKDRHPIWIKLYNSTLDDYDFGKLPDASKAHLVAIWLLASRNDNAIPLDPDWVGKRINASEPVDLEILRDLGFIQYNQDDSNTLAERYQVAMPEKRREREEKRREDTSSLRSDVAKPKRKTRASLPFGFPFQEDLDWARALWLQKGRADLCSLSEEEAAKFRDHHAGKMTMSADWPASWRTWSRNTIKFNNGGRNGRDGRTAHENFAAGALAAATGRRSEDESGDLI